MHNFFLKWMVRFPKSFLALGITSILLGVFLFVAKPKLGTPVKETRSGRYVTRYWDTKEEVKKAEKNNSMRSDATFLIAMGMYFTFFSYKIVKAKRSGDL